MKLFGLIGLDANSRRSVLVRLVEELARRGVKVGTLHEAPTGFDPDRPGKDSYEHRKAGAFEVLLMAPHISALMHENGGRPSPGVTELAQQMRGAELILVDGFESGPHPKARVGGNTCAGRCDASVIALIDLSDLDIEALADLVLARAAEV
jgi:molybdopterin-guanine dinucleotide biosynthesis protein B